MIQKITFVVAAILSCPKIEIQNKTKVWNKQDRAALSTATKGCSQQYPDAPCLKMFRKVEQGIYSAVCAAPSSKK